LLPLIIYRRALQFFIAGLGATLGIRSAAQLLEARRLAAPALQRDWDAIGEDMEMALRTYEDEAFGKE